MAQHKAPTQVSIAPLAEKSGFEQAVSRYWMSLTAIAIAIGAGIVWTQLADEQELASVAEDWDALRSQVDLDTITELPASSELRVLADELEPTAAGPWARALEIQSSIKANEFQQVGGAIDKLSVSFPKHPLVDQNFEFGDEDAPSSETIPAHIREIAESQESWAAQHGLLFAPPEVAEDSPRVTLETDYGSITIGLYPELAPKHVENFVKLCNEGFYDGVKFHRVVDGALIQTGDPNSKEGDPSTWGTGGPGYTISPEINQAWHFEGMLAAARNPAETESSGSQFYITSSKQHQFDKEYTVFGRVLEGMDVVKVLATQAGEGSERPENPATLLSAQVL